MQEKREIILTENGMMRRIIQELPIGNAEAILAEAASGVGIDMPSIFGTADKTIAHMRVTRNLVTVYAMQRGLNMNTVWRPYADSKLCYPHGFKDGPADFGATYYWTKPESMALFIIQQFKYIGGAWAAGETYLIATRKGDGAYYRLPMTNIYEEARVCMGAWKLEGKTFQQWYDHAVKHLANSPWNCDLRDQSRTEDMQAIFSFKLDGTQAPVPEDWHKHCKKVNHAAYSEFKGMLIPADKK